MRTDISLPVPAVLLRPPLRGPDAPRGSSREGWVPAASPAVAVARIRNGRLRRMVRALGEFGELLAVVYAFPLAILAVGIPIALFVRLLRWMVGAA
jgi:hypothetical protein